MKYPFFTISLDFELFWGMRDVTTLKHYGKNILGGREAIPKILNLFKKENIHATWGIVGFITFSNKTDLLDSLPDHLPMYKDKKLNPYLGLDKIGKNEKEDPYHFGHSLVNQILETDGMEIASHSFSHFYCEEKNENEHSFDSDLKASLYAFNRLGIKPESYIFCRNQYDKPHLKSLKKNGFRVFRGNEKSIIFKPKANKIIRAARLFDSYINLSGANLSNLSLKEGLVDVPSSRFLRPSQRKILDKLRLNRIFSSMTEAAKQNSGFHLWWHPHNFGLNLDQNLFNLKKILNHFHFLNKKYNMQSLNMIESSRLFKLDD